MGIDYLLSIIPHPPCLHIPRISSPLPSPIQACIAMQASPSPSTPSTGAVKTRQTVLPIGQRFCSNAGEERTAKVATDDAAGKVHPSNA